MATTLKENNLNKYGVTTTKGLKKELQRQNNKKSILWKIDVDALGKIQKFQTKNNKLNKNILSKHGKIEYFAGLLWNAGLYNKARSILSCGAVVIYGKKGNKIVPVSIQRCHSRYCPNCRALRYKEKATIAERVVSKALKDNPNCRFLEVTVCPKNARDWSTLDHTIRKMNASISKVARYAGIKEFCYGVIRSDEIPLSVKGKLYSYNVHCNCMFFMDKSFFSGRNMLTKKHWKQRFKQAMKIDYLPDMYFKRIKETKDTQGNVTSMVENAKKRVTYDMKQNTLIETINNNPQLNQNSSQYKIIRDYMYGTKNSNDVGYIGLMASIKKEIKALDNIRKNQSKDKQPITMYYQYRIETIDPVTLEKSFRLVSVSNYNPLHQSKRIQKLVKKSLLQEKKYNNQHKIKHGFGTPTLISGARV